MNWILILTGDSYHNDLYLTVRTVLSVNPNTSINVSSTSHALLSRMHDAHCAPLYLIFLY